MANSARVTSLRHERSQPRRGQEVRIVILERDLPATASYP